MRALSAREMFFIVPLPQRFPLVFMRAMAQLIRHQSMRGWPARPSILDLSPHKKLTSPIRGIRRAIFTGRAKAENLLEA
jgi:hypothetical protein